MSRRDIAPIRPAKPLQLFFECPNPGLSFWITLRTYHQHADAPHWLRFLRARRERPRRRRAAEQRDEVAPLLVEQTRAGPLLSVLYPMELNEMGANALRDHSGQDFADMVVDHFEEMLENSTEQPWYGDRLAHIHLWSAVSACGHCESP